MIQASMSSVSPLDAVLSGATPPKLPPHVQQQPLREEKETWQITDSAEESGMCVFSLLIGMFTIEVFTSSISH